MSPGAVQVWFHRFSREKLGLDGASLTARREAADKLTSRERLTALAKESHALTRIVAKNPSSPISLLRDLSRSEDEATRKSVISNPSASYDVLSYLESQFPESFVNNPALQLYNSLKP
jgi:hypothetical protein